MRLHDPVPQPASFPVVTLVSGEGCHLCDQAREVLLRARTEIGFTLREIAIDGDPQLERLYRAELPVVLLDGQKRFKYRVDPVRLRRLLLRDR